MPRRILACRAHLPLWLSLSCLLGLCFTLWSASPARAQECTNGAPCAALPTLAEVQAAAAVISDAGAAPQADFVRLVFQSRRTGNWEIFVARGDGSAPVNLTDHPADDTHPRLTRDGQRVLFLSNRRDATPSQDKGPVQMWVVNSDGTGLRRVTELPFAPTTPAWSPDGRTIVFAMASGGRGRDIYAIDADGGNLRRLSNIEVDEYAPTFTPDGKAIVYAMMLRGGGALVAMYPDGSRKAWYRGPYQSAYYFNPRFSPDGGWLAWTQRSDASSGRGLVMIDRVPGSAASAGAIPGVAEAATLDLLTGAHAVDTAVPDLVVNPGDADSLAQAWLPVYHAPESPYVFWQPFFGLLVTETHPRGSDGTPGWTGTVAYGAGLPAIRYDSAPTDANFDAASLDHTPPYARVAPIGALVDGATAGRARVFSADLGPAGLHTVLLQYLVEEQNGNIVPYTFHVPPGSGSVPGGAYVSAGVPVLVRASAIDRAGNVAPWRALPPFVVYRTLYEVLVTDARGQPVPGATLDGDPHALRREPSDAFGVARLWSYGNPYTLTITHPLYGSSIVDLKPIMGMPARWRVPFVYGLVGNAVLNGSFDAGAHVLPWRLTGGARLDGTAILLEGPRPAEPGWHTIASISQFLPAERTARLISPTLRWHTRVWGPRWDTTSATESFTGDAIPADESAEGPPRLLYRVLVSEPGVVTPTVAYSRTTALFDPLTGGGVPLMADLAAWRGHPFTLTFELQWDGSGATFSPRAVVDNVQIGAWGAPVLETANIAPAIAAVEGIAGTLMITGRNLEPGIVFWLGETRLAGASRQPDGTLHAPLPASLPPGQHRLRAVNPGGFESFSPFLVAIGTPVHLPLMQRQE